MRTLLFAAFICIISWNADAQITLTASVVPGPGTSYKEYFGADSLNPGPAGANQTWNFSSIVKIDSFVNSFVACSSTPWCSSFPGATMAIVDEFGYYSYLTVSSTVVAHRGWYDSSGGELTVYSDPSDVLRFPFTYNNAYVDAWASSRTTSGVTYKQSGQDSIKADAWGKLILPNGVYNNVLRVRTITHFVDSMFVSGTGSLLGSRRDESYSWFALNRAPLLTAGTTTYTPSGGSPSSSWYSSYTSQSPTGVKESGLPDLSVKVFPNPAHELLQLSFNINEPIELRISLADITGRIVLELPVAAYRTGSHLLKLNTGQLSRGMYFLCLNSGTGFVSRKVEIN